MCSRFVAATCFALIVFADAVAADDTNATSDSNDSTTAATTTTNTTTTTEAVAGDVSNTTTTTVAAAVESEDTSITAESTNSNQSSTNATEATTNPPTSNASSTTAMPDANATETTTVAPETTSTNVAASSELVTTTTNATALDTKCIDVCPDLNALLMDLNEVIKDTNQVVADCIAVQDHLSISACIMGEQACGHVRENFAAVQQRCNQLGVDITSPAIKIGYNQTKCAVCAKSGGAIPEETFYEMPRAACETRCSSSPNCVAYDFDYERNLCRTWKWCPEDSHSNKYGCAWSVYQKPESEMPTSAPTAPPPEVSGVCPPPHSDTSCPVCALGSHLAQLNGSVPCQECFRGGKGGTKVGACDYQQLTMCTLQCLQAGYTAEPVAIVCNGGKWTTPDGDFVEGGSPFKCSGIQDLAISSASHAALSVGLFLAFIFAP
eukprot:gnl/TRDRNA2_/TRDRNA2_189220_c0_seq1.p1 gnl/TRDRNA2_/TRDRNA2_189220_c0~~gnl/TRDRNA2_/TRDRNA2_189220_c0_seq1.p1  ORF type:complete len:437 (+),score=71.91 gnl/TRDRNA2_/TRDRNA2_189220_c0_seq1:76-1386(+)